MQYILVHSNSDMEIEHKVFKTAREIEKFLVHEHGEYLEDLNNSEFNKEFKVFEVDAFELKTLVLIPPKELEVQII